MRSWVKIRKLIEQVRVLAGREIKSRYYGSILGPMWVFFYPMSLSLIMSVVFSNLIKINSGGTPYVIFALSGLMLWTFFSKSVVLAMKSLIMNRQLVVGTSIELEALPYSYVVSQAPDVIVNTIALLLLMISNHIQIGAGFIYVPFFVIVFGIFIAGVSLILAIPCTIYKDFQNLSDAIILLLFYGTPFFYPLEMLPNNLRWIIELNPLTKFVLFFRGLVLDGKVPTFYEWVNVLLISIFTYSIGKFFFNMNKHLLPDLV